MKYYTRDDIEYVGLAIAVIRSNYEPCFIYSDEQWVSYFDYYNIHPFLRKTIQKIIPIFKLSSLNYTWLQKVSKNLVDEENKFCLLCKQINLRERIYKILRVIIFDNITTDKIDDIPEMFSEIANFYFFHAVPSLRE